MKKITTILLLTLTLLLSSCKKNTIDDKHLIIGASITPHKEILDIAKPILEEKGYKVTIKAYTDYIIPNEALNNNELDANFFQHTPYLKQYNEANKTNLIPVLSVHFEPLGLYAQHETLDIKENATIAIPNDATNGARALLLLQDLNIIKLDASKGILTTKKDIIENPKQIKIVEFEAANIPNQLNSVDYAIINGNYALASNLLDKCLITEDPTSLAAQTYANVIAVKQGHENKQAILDLIDALKTESVKTFIKETYQGVVVSVLD